MKKKLAYFPKREPRRQAKYLSVYQPSPLLCLTCGWMRMRSSEVLTAFQSVNKWKWRKPDGCECPWQADHPVTGARLAGLCCANFPDQSQFQDKHSRLWVFSSLFLRQALSPALSHLQRNSSFFLFSYFWPDLHWAKAIVLFPGVQHCQSVSRLRKTPQCILLFPLRPCPHSICSGFIAIPVMKQPDKRQHGGGGKVIWLTAPG